jgi:hypothetical protein
MAARRIVAPQVEAEQRVELQRGLLPLVELGRVAQRVEPEIYGAAPVVPLAEFL